MLNAYIGRQAIYTREKEVYAYELLYRSGASGAADFVDSSQATSQVVLNSFLEIGLEKLVGTCPAFINCTRDSLIHGHSLALPPERLVLEVLEDIEPDAEILATLRSLKDAGYTIALDDFVLRESRNPLLKLADLIKVELPALTRDEIAQHVDALRPCGVTLLAEKVETQEEFEFCSELGFDLFQGYFLSMPHVVQERRAPASRLAMLDALMDQPMAELLSQLPRCDDINRALTRREGRLGAVLHCTMAYERGDWDATRALDLSAGKLQHCYLEALDWANGVTRELMAA